LRGLMTLTSTNLGFNSSFELDTMYTSQTVVTSSKARRLVAR